MNQSGIGISQTLAKEFPTFVAGHDRAVILKIEDEACELHQRVSSCGDRARDFEAVQSNLAPNRARFVVFRLKDQPLEFLFISFMPNQEALREKLKYASSTNTILKELGGSQLFPQQVVWTEIQEVSEEGWRAQIRHEEAAAPLTKEEESLKTATEYERLGTQTKSVAGQSTLGIAANVTGKVQDAVEQLHKGAPNSSVAVFNVDHQEQVVLCDLHLATDNYQKHFHNVEPRYGLIRHADKLVFVYVCPQKANFKDRMVFASTRIAFLEWLKNKVPISGVVS